MPVFSKAKVKPDSFHINLPKPTYYAGETISGGTVTLETTKDIKCRCVKFRIVGEGFSFFWYTNPEKLGEKEGDRQEVQVTHRVQYFRETHTLWGRFHRTEEIDGGGKNVIFGSPYSPNEGVLLIPCEDQEAPLICRVMDEDWGKKDDTLGEIVIKSPSTLVDDCTAAGGKITLDLRHKGKEGKGTVTLSATWAATSDGVPKLRIQVFSALGLRSAEMFGKNDVYVQIYPAADMKWNEAKALPEPPKSAILPEGKYTFDLPDLKLPDKLPGTFEISQPRRWSSKAYTHGHVRYYLEASIDIAWNFDPFVRIPFSVSSRLPSSLIAGSVPSSVPQKETYPVAPCCGCALSCCSPTGVVGMDATLSRNGGAPGEWLVLSGSLTNGTAQELVLEVKLTRTTLLSVEPPSYMRKTLHRKVWHTWTCTTLPLSAKEAGAEPAPTQVFVPFEIPTVPASYHGGMLKDDEWEAKIKEIGMAKQASAGMFASNKDPVVWWYDITVSFGVAGGDGNTLKVTHPFIVASIPQIVMPTVSMGVILGGDAAPVNAEMVEAEGMSINGSVNLPRAIPMAACLAVPLDTLAAANDQVVWAGVVLPDGAKGGDKVSCENNFDGNRDGNPCNDLTYQPVFPKVIMPKPEPPEQAVFPV